jgi:MFS family permease
MGDSMANNKTLRTFYIIIITQTFSLIGSQMTSLAIGIKVFNDTNQVTPLALVGFFYAIPPLFAASFAGVFADRWDRRLMMIVGDVGQAFSTLLLIISFASGAFELWHLYAATVIQSVFAVLQRPAFSAAITMLVPDDHRDRANAIRQLTEPASGIIAPILTGALFVLIDVEGIMAFDLFTFAVAMIAMALLHIPRPKETAEGQANKGSIWKEAKVGFSFLSSRRPLLIMLLYVSLLNFILSMAMILNTPYVLTITGSEAMLGTLLSVMSLGAILGGVVMGIWGGTRPRIHTIMPGIIVVGLALGFYGVGRSSLALGIALFIMMVPLPMINASFSSIMQVKTPPDLQGRVFAVLSQISMMLMPLAYLISGPLADKVFEPAVGRSGWDIVSPFVGSAAGAGMGLIMLICGIVTVAVSVIAYVVPMIRHMEAALPDYKAEAVEEVEHRVPVPQAAAAEG